MNTGKVKVYTQHEENKEWLAKLDFYADAIKVLRDRLAEIVSKNTSKIVLAKSEQFQNQLFIQKNTIDIIRHKINLGEDKIREEVERNITAVDHRRIADHADIRDEMKLFEKVFTGIKADLTLSLIKWM